MDPHTISVLSEKSDSTDLIISNKNIHGILDLNGYFDVQILDCFYNYITQILNIPHGLKYLNCSYNLISCLDFPNLAREHLEKIIFKSNPIVELNYPFVHKPINYFSEISSNEHTNTHQIHPNYKKNKKSIPTLKKLIFNDNYNDSIDNLPFPTNLFKIW